MAVQQSFPRTYHTGDAEAFKNSNFNIFTATAENEYSDADTGIDFYTFKENPAEADSPEQSFVLFIVKNTGSPNSLLDIDDLTLVTDLTGTANPFSLIEDVGDLGSTATDGLSITLTLPSFVTTAAGYVALNPAPIGYVRINANTVDVTNQTFGTAGVERFIPFYSPSVISGATYGIGCYEHDYGTGVVKYPHYAAFLIKCNPAIPLEITEGDVMLQLVQSTGNTINVNLVMESFNEGNLQYQQGFLTDTEEIVDVGVGTWAYGAHASHSNLGTIAGTPGTPNVGDLDVATPYISNAIPAWNFASQPMADNFFTGYMPAGFNYQGLNMSLDGRYNKNVDTRIPCVKISDSTTTQGGVRFLQSGMSYWAVMGYNTFTAPPNGFQQHNFVSDQGVDNAAFYIVSGGTAPLVFNFSSPYTTSNEVTTLGSQEFYYLVWDAKSIKNFEHTTVFSFTGGLPYINAVTTGGKQSWSAAIGSYPVYHKDYFINADNNAPTQVEMIQAVSGTYGCMGINQLHHSRLITKAFCLSFGANPPAWSVDDTNYSNAITGTDTQEHKANSGFALHDDLDTVVTFNRRSYYKTEAPSTVSGHVLDKVSTLTHSSSTSYNDTNGLVKLTKNLHIRDLFRFPDTTADNTTEILSTVKPVVCWQNFNDSEGNWYSRHFNWNDDYLLTNTTYNGSLETETESPIQVHNLLTSSSNDSMSGRFVPAGYHVVNTSGVESNGNPITLQATNEGTLSFSNQVFNDGTGFETLTVSGRELKQKSIRLATKFQAGVLGYGEFEGFSEVASASSNQPYSEMNWDSLRSGDEIGRYKKSGTFTIKPDRLIKAGSISGRMDTANHSSGLGQENISFTLWTYVYPIYAGAHLDNISPQQYLADDFYYTSHGSNLDQFTASSWSAGDVVTDTHREQLAQSLSLSSGIGGQSMQEQKYANGNPASAASYKRYPFNGSGVFKFENYFATEDEATNMGSAPYTAAYGILPGPRRQGRFTGSNSVSAMVSNKFIFKRNLRLNSAAGKYESFIPLDFGINKANSDYRVQLVNICLDNEMINPGSDTPTFADPSKIFDITNNAASASEFMLPIADVNTNPKTAPITQFVVSGITLNTSINNIDLGSDAYALGVRVGQLVTASSPSALSGGRTVTSLSGDTVTLNAVPDSNVGSQVLMFTWEHQDYASWAIVHGSRELGQATTIKACRRSPNAKERWQKWDSNFVKPYSWNSAPDVWTNTSWDIDNHPVGALDFIDKGRLRVMPGISDPDANNPSGTQSQSLISNYTNSTGVSYSDSNQGSPHIYFGIDRTKIESNNINEGVFYNRVRIRYILHNKLDNYGVLQRDISGNSFGTEGKGHSFQTGAGTKAHVYEDTYLVKMTFNAVTPTLVLSDVDGDSASNLSTINFGTIHS